LVAHIRDVIQTRGPVTFAWFMEQALYHPEDGYYSSGRAMIGREGDYFTSVSVGSLFGRLLAAQFAEIWERLGRPTEFTIVEQGAHRGEFARDVLESARATAPAFFQALRYTIVEPFETLRRQQVAMLSAFNERIAWRVSLDQLAPFTGLHFSNELIDSMPVHVVDWTGGEWIERHIGLAGEDFVFIDLPLSSETLAEQLRRVGMRLPAGYVTEVNLAALDWIRAVTRKLEQGYIIAVDYGFARDEFYAPHRTAGTLRSYSRHKTLPDPLANVGSADITAHVEWTSLAESAVSSGLQITGFTDQHHFLTGLLTEALARELEHDAGTARALQTLLHPGFLGMKFQFLVLSKNVNDAATLRGLRFARDAKTALNLPLDTGAD
jgi:SAM-dependent MidA family methyltransferase